MNILLIITFKGTNFHGFQVQQNAVTICSTLQDAMFKILGNKPDIKGCSRTDSGVHALQYCLNFKYDLKIPLKKFPLALNAHLPNDIRVLQALHVSNDFHARYHCIKKEYIYIFLNSHIDDPFMQGLYYRVFGTIDDEKMHEASQYFVGQHDFLSFMSLNSSIKDTVRTIYEAKVKRTDDKIVFSVCADGFLYNMVRIMAGTLLNVGIGINIPEDINSIIQGRNRTLAGDTLPAKGLFLNRVFYDDRFINIENKLAKKGISF